MIDGVVILNPDGTGRQLKQELDEIISGFGPLYINPIVFESPKFRRDLISKPFISAKANRLKTRALISRARLTETSTGANSNTSHKKIALNRTAEVQVKCQKYGENISRSPDSLNMHRYYFYGNKAEAGIATQPLSNTERIRTRYQDALNPVSKIFKKIDSLPKDNDIESSFDEDLDKSTSLSHRKLETVFYNPRTPEIQASDADRLEDSFTKKLNSQVLRSPLASLVKKVVAKNNHQKNDYSLHIPTSSGNVGNVFKRTLKSKFKETFKRSMHTQEFSSPAQHILKSQPSFLLSISKQLSGPTNKKELGPSCSNFDLLSPHNPSLPSNLFCFGGSN